MLSRIVSYLFVLIIALTSPIFFVFAVLIWGITMPIDRRKVILQYYTCFWGAFYTWIMPLWIIRVKGRDKVRKNETYMVVSNHQSQLDILVNFRLFFHYKILSKEEIFRVPFIGWNMSMNRYIRLRRGDKNSINEMMEKSENHLREGSSVFIYPEGTRSTEETLGTFREGAFILAKKVGVPILPIIIDGTREALPKYTMNSDGLHRINVQVIDEIPLEIVEKLSVQELAEYTRDYMGKALKELQVKKVNEKK